MSDRYSPTSWRLRGSVRNSAGPGNSWRRAATMRSPPAAGTGGWWLATTLLLRGSVLEGLRGEGRAVAGSHGRHEVAVTGSKPALFASGPVVEERVGAVDVPAGGDVVQHDALGRHAELAAEALP